MLKIRRSVRVIGPDGEKQVELVVSMSEPGEERRYEIALQLNVSYLGSSEHGMFFALQDLRRKLEPVGILLQCLGAREDVYPTPMMQSMGPSLIGVRHTPGRQTTEQDVVDIFDEDFSDRCVSVDQQEAWHKAFLENWRKKR